jgi:hypothetical protein
MLPSCLRRGRANKTGCCGSTIDRPRAAWPRCRLGCGAASSKATSVRPALECRAGCRCLDDLLGRSSDKRAPARVRAGTGKAEVLVEPMKPHLNSAGAHADIALAVDDMVGRVRFVPAAPPRRRAVRREARSCGHRSCPCWPCSADDKTRLGCVGRPLLRTYGRIMVGINSSRIKIR